MPSPSEPPHFSRSAEELIAALRRLPSEPGRQRRRPTRDAASLVEDLMVKYQIGRPSSEQTIRDHWTELVGAANASYSHAVQIDPRGRLAVIASHSVVRNELFLHRQTILEHIRALPGCGHVRSLLLRTG